MARRKIVMLVAGLAALALGVGLGGCKDLTFNGDMKGYLEYWTGTVTVGGFTWEAENDQRQKNKFGVWTIPTNAKVSIKATIENPDNYPLDYGVGTAADTLRSVRTAGPVGGTVRVTGSSPTNIELELVPFSSVPTPESRALEHRDFTLTVVPTRTDSGLQAANPQVLTLRYNTPPRMPVEVVEEGGNLKLLGSDEWEMVRGTSTNLDNKIYWAWPKDITDPKDPDYAARFRVYQDDVLKHDKAESEFRLDKVVPNLLPTVTEAVTKAGYDIYAADVEPNKTITIKAVDSEGVASQGTVSGRPPVKITLNGAGGTFKNDTQTAEVYKAQGAFVSGGDFETPQQTGSVLSGWSESPGGDPITFPYEIPQTDTPLYALWRSDWSGYISSLGPGSHRVEIKDSLTAEDVYALRAAIAASPSTLVTLDLSKATLPNDTLPADAFNGEYTPQGKLSNLVAVTLPDNLAGVGDHAFQNTGLSSVTIPGSVDTIGEDAFADCAQLASVTIKAGVQTIGQGAFHGCPALNSVTIEDGVTSIEPWAFDNCSALTSVTIPGSVDTIGEDAFRNCSALTSVIIEDGVKTIERGAFYDCSALTTVDIPNTVTSIGQDAFRRSGLTSVDIPGSVDTIGQDAFKECSALTSITIADGVETIDYAAFAYTGLTSVDIPGSVKTIGEDAFYGCDQLKNVTIADGVQTIGGEAFYNCTSLTSVDIPGSVKTIGQGAFHNCDQLTSVTLKAGVETIEQDAFYGCDQLTNVTMEDGVETIGQGAFFACSALTQISIPDSVTSIGPYAFQRSGLTSVTIPGSVTRIGLDAFHSCAQLKTVTIEDGVQTIEQGAFYDCSGLTTVDIPNTVTSIGYGAFQNSGLTSVAIPASVKTIGTSAFSGCGQLKNVTIEHGVTSIEGAAFNGSGLTSVTIPGSVQTWGNHAFANCPALTSVTLEEGVPSIGHGAFDGCGSLTTLTLPVSLTYISVYNFRSAALTVNYRGSQDQWNNVRKESAGNWQLTSATVNYNYTSP